MSDGTRPATTTGAPARHGRERPRADATIVLVGDGPRVPGWRGVLQALARLLVMAAGAVPATAVRGPSAARGADDGAVLQEALAPSEPGMPAEPSAPLVSTASPPAHGGAAPLADSDAVQTPHGAGEGTPPRPELEVVKHGMWRHVAMDRAARLGAEVRAMASAHPEVGLDGVRESLERARTIAREGKLEGRRPGIFSPARTIENCWRALHLAEEELVLHIPENDEPRILAAARTAQEHARRQLPADDVLVQALTGLPEGQGSDAAARRDAAVEVLRASHAASTAQHRRQRSFQNQLRLLCTLLALLAAAAVLVLARRGTPLDLIPIPPGLGGDGAALLLALVAGGMGALFSALPSLSQLPAQSSPFDPVREQAALKIIVGAWSAVVGLVVVHAGVAGVETGGADPASLAGWVVTAAAFGAAQEALTRFADRKADEVAPATE